MHVNGLGVALFAALPCVSWGCEARMKTEVPSAPVSTRSQIAAIKDVSAIEVRLERMETTGPPTILSARSEDRATIAAALATLSSGDSVEDCKCPDIGEVRFLGPSLDVRISIMPGHTHGRMDFHDSFHQRWSRPIARIQELLCQVGIKDAGAVLRQYEQRDEVP